MNTFLPYPSFEASAAVLDNKRLGKQRVEAYQILRTLTGQSKGWQHHPAVRMWKGSEWYLCLYGIVICSEWIRRGFKDSLLQIFVIALVAIGTTAEPPWLGDDLFHKAMRSNLLRKDSQHYSQFFNDVPNDLPYIWPVK